MRLLTRRSLLVGCVWVLMAVAGVSAVAGSELSDDLRARRERLMQSLGPDAMLVLWSAPVQRYSNDTDYEYRQDSNMLYLAGLDQPSTILVLMPGNRTRRELLFIAPRDPEREHWDGKRLDRSEATAESGVATVHLATEFDTFMAAVLRRRSFGGAEPNEYDAFFAALEGNRARLHMLLGPRPGPDAPLSPALEFASRIRDRYFGFTVADVTNTIFAMRQVKTPVEMSLLRESGVVSSEAHRAGMSAARPGRFEYEVEAAIEYTFKRRGAQDWAYPSIVASGPNANILHYEKSSRRMNDGDLLLVDAAADYKHYTVDITRTYPVNGTFSAAQRDIYSLVLRAQAEAEKVPRVGVSLRDVHRKAADVIREGLFALGLVTDVASDQYRLWFTHSSIHWLGLDVHDVGDTGRTLEAGMAFVIEPGVYIQANALDLLPRTPDNLAFIEKVKPAFEKYKNIGVRVEDSYLLTTSGLERLSSSVPRTPEELEAFLRIRPVDFGLR